MIYVYTKMPSPVGELTLVASPRGLAAVLWEADAPTRVPLGPLERADGNAILQAAVTQLVAYFAGTRHSFAVELDFHGTPFQKRVWAALLTVPFGQTRSYGAIAAQIGHPSASRAVGAAIGRNPISIIVPCHRVVGATGKLTGFAGGLSAKQMLLRLEAEAGSARAV